MNWMLNTNVHPSDPLRIEDSEEKGMIEVHNATGVELYLVLVPVSCDSEKTSRVQFTGNNGFGAPRSVSDHDCAVKTYMLPAGFTPDDVVVPAGGTFLFSPPPGEAQAKLLVATLSEESHAGTSVRVVVLHGRFNTRTGKRRVVFPTFLESRSKLYARLGPDDNPVDAVMIMAGLASTTASSTLSPTPQDGTLSVANTRLRLAWHPSPR